mmetsp:Transcript_46255/g.110045  ORF Transcript_46255/g.110045 Transcript_46255/m.110045 type:complete len:604 (+) Transcript_46255:96-1907(+)
MLRGTGERTSRRGASRLRRRVFGRLLLGLASLMVLMHAGGVSFIPGKPLGMADRSQDLVARAPPVEVEVVEPVSGMTGATKSQSKLAASGKSSSSIAALAALPVLQLAVGTARAVSGTGNSRASKVGRTAAYQQEDIVGETTKVVIPVLAAFFGWIAVMYAIQHSIIGLPFLDAAGAQYFPIIATFIAGYLVIVLEEQTDINKAATALVLGVLIWVFVGTGLDLTPAQFSTDIKETLVDVSEVVFFLLGALTIVEIMDAHRGFDIITKAISATKARDLLLVIGVLTFALSSVLNNLTVVIVMVSLLQKLIKDVDYRMRLGGIVVVASNAGGAWTPIGDITTTMLYIGGQVTTIPLLANLVFPSVLCLIGTLGYEYLQTEDKEMARPASAGDENAPPPEGQALVFWGGLGGMVTVPVFTALTQCPPWTGMMLVLGLLGVITSLLHEPGDDRYSLKGALTRVEVPDCLFFLGVLFAVGGLERVGLLKEFAVQLSQLVPSDAIVAVLLGFASAVVDNVPLVAATQGMYDLTAHPANDALWNLITYCAATGGSLLVIGSAAGVAFMGMERGVSFGWYLQRVSPAALIGYLAGVGGILLQQQLGLTLS